MMTVYNTCCHNCLFSPNRIVSPERAKELIDTCKKDQTFFICHKSSMEDGNIMCKAFYDNFREHSQLYRIAHRLRMVQFVDQPNEDKLPSHNQITTN